MEAVRKPGLPCFAIPKGYLHIGPPSEGGGWLRHAALLVETQLARDKASVGAEMIERTDADVPILPAGCHDSGYRALQFSKTPVAASFVLLEQAEAALSLPSPSSTCDSACKRSRDKIPAWMYASTQLSKQ